MERTCISYCCGAFQICLFFFKMRKLEMVQNTRQHHFAYTFNEFLAETDSHATQKWAEAVMVTFFSWWSKTHRTAAVKSLRNELCWLDPLFRVVAEMADSNWELVPFSKMNSCSLYILTHLDSWGIVYWWLNSERFIEAVWIELKLLNIIIGKNI